MNAWYLAYGSNLHPVRLRQRVPSAAPQAVVELTGQGLHFDKLGGDGSAKCTIEPAGHDITVWAVLYRMDAAEVALLDGYEGLGHGYDRYCLSLEQAGTGLAAFTYRADESHRCSQVRAYDWYRDIVLLGARYFGFPADYVQTIAAVPADPDPDPERAAAGRELLQSAALYSRRQPWGDPADAPATGGQRSVYRVRSAG